ncbi:hypothetical protein [Pseudolactococcus plantarum]|uniref:hypothetical protein n=1 Tax=Pseudolactococcus plantarum TaxID=1365 RepID=UPI00082F6DDE|nr:hypothetical protein [Lactococcus plantarum]
MSLNQYSKHTAKSKIIKLGITTPELVDSFLNSLDNFKNKRIYTSYVQRKFSISKQDSRKIISILVDSDILITVFQIKIRDKTFPKEYTTFSEIPDFIFDDDLYADLKVDLTKDVFVFFKVNKNE